MQIWIGHHPISLGKMWISVGVTPNMMLFQAITESILHATMLALPDPDRPFSVVCDASDFAIGSALLQTDVDERESVIAFNLDSSKLLKRTIQFMTKGYLL